MDTNNSPFDVLQLRLKSARRKKRLQKKDFDKQLIQLDKKRGELWERRYRLPWVPLDTPYQRGWKRMFFLREDVLRSAQASFYEELLTKINTTDYSPGKSFKGKKKHRKSKIRLERRQYLREFSERQWNYSDLKLTEPERAHFHSYEKTCHCGKCKELAYRFNEPWRYVLKVRPHIITHAKLKDNVLEQEIQLLDNLIRNKKLDRRMGRLKGRPYRYYWDKETKISYRNPLKNKSLTAFLESWD